jgi:hypothetical protein
MTIKPLRDGSLSPKDAKRIITCYKRMKHYYETRDAYYNAIMSGGE